MKKKHKAEDIAYHELYKGFYEVVTIHGGGTPIHWGDSKKLIPFMKELYNKLKERENFINSPNCVSNDMKAYCQRVNNIGKKISDFKMELIGCVDSNYKIADYV